MKKYWLGCLLLVASCFSLWGEQFIRTRLPLQRNGYQLFLQSVKSAKSQPQTNLLMVHGMTYASHYFDLPYRDYSLMEYLAQQGYTVWRLDIAGFGQSDPVADGFLPTSDYAAQDIAAAVEAILKQSGAQKLDLLGWSWGTVTSSKYALKHPQKLRKLILYAPIVTGIFERRVTVTSPFVREAWRGAEGDFQQDKSGQVDAHIAEPGLVACYKQNCRKFDKNLIPNASRREVFSSKKDVLIPLDKLQVPVLLILGSSDPYLNTARIYQMFPRLTAGSELIVINGGAHAVFLEKPFYRQFRSHLWNFLKLKDMAKNEK